MLSVGGVGGYLHYRWVYLCLLRLAALPFLTGFISKEAGVLGLIFGGLIGGGLICVRLRLTVAYSWRLAMRLRSLSSRVGANNFPGFLARSLFIRGPLLISG